MKGKKRLYCLFINLFESELMHDLKNSARYIVVVNAFIQGLGWFQIDRKL